MSKKLKGAITLIKNLFRINYYTVCLLRGSLYARMHNELRKFLRSHVRNPEDIERSTLLMLCPYDHFKAGCVPEQSM